MRQLLVVLLVILIGAGCSPQDSQDPLGNTYPEAWEKVFGKVEDPGHMTWEYYVGPWDRGEFCPFDEKYRGMNAEGEEVVVEVCRGFIKDPSVALFAVTLVTPTQFDDVVYGGVGAIRVAGQIKYFIVVSAVSAPVWVPLADILSQPVIEAIWPAMTPLQKALTDLALLAGEDGKELTAADIESDVAAGNPNGSPPNCPPGQKPGLPKDAILATSTSSTNSAEKFIVHNWTTAGGEVIGHAVMNMVGLQDGLTVIVPHVVVVPKFRGQGIATQILEELNKAWIQRFGGTNTIVSMENWNPTFPYSCYMQGKTTGPNYRDPSGPEFPTHWLVPPG